MPATRGDQHALGAVRLAAVGAVVALQDEVDLVPVVSAPVADAGDAV